MGDSADAAGNLLAVLGFLKTSKTGLFTLLKKLKGRIPKKALERPDGSFVLEIEKVKIEVPGEVIKLYRDLPTRKAAEAVVEPLKKPGIDTLEVRTYGEKATGAAEVAESVVKEEVAFFTTPALPEEKIEESERTAWFSITALAFKEDNKWRLSDGSSTFYVTIEDKEFLRKVDESLVSFSKGDLLRVRLQTRQWATQDGLLKTEYIATEIIEHRSGVKQIPLPLHKVVPPDPTHDL